MNKFDFSFLSNVNALEIVKEHKPKGKVATPKNPEGLRLRIFKDGSVYPSQELVDKFNLNYSNRNDLDLTACGFDVFSSKDWVQYPKEVQQAIFIAAVPKSEAKVTLFGQVDYNEDGTPINSVMTQGAKRPQIIEWLRDVYNKQADLSAGVLDTPIDDLFGSKNYVDLEVNTEVVVFEGLPKYYIPKQFVKGPKVGQMTYEERTGLTIYPLTIVESVETNED